MEENERLSRTNRKEEVLNPNQTPIETLIDISKRVNEIDSLIRNIDKVPFDDITFYGGDFYYKATGKSFYIEKKEDAIPFLREAKNAYFDRYLKVIKMC